MDSGKSSEGRENAWLAALFRDEAALREVFASRPELMKELLRNKGFLDTLFDGKTGAFTTLLASPAESTAGVDALIGMFPGDDGGSATPRQMTVAGKLGTWLADGEKAERAFRENPELTQALVGNPAFVERVKVLKPELFQELLNKGKERFRGDAAMQIAIRKSESELVTFTGEGSWHNEQAKAIWELGEQLVEAARAGDERAVKSLLMQKDVEAFVDHQNGDGLTALLRAASRGHRKVVKLLLDKGADPNLLTTWGTTALIRAAGEGHTEVLKLLLDFGADPNLKDSHGTALAYAAGRGCTEAVELLLDRGADANLENRSGWTALMWAARFGHMEIVKLLLANGADVNFQSGLNDTALIWAASVGHTEAVKLLLDNGADPNLRNAVGMTALMQAARYGHTEAVKLLLDKGAEDYLQDGRGWTTLIYAVNGGYTKAVKLLLDNGADPNQQTRSGTTALKWAVNCGYQQIAGLLRAAVKQKGPRPWTGREHDRRGSDERERG
jgi:ankyrin repeat protein